MAILFAGPLFCTSFGKSHICFQTVLLRVMSKGLQMKGGEREKEEENGEIAYTLSSMNKKNKESSHFSVSIFLEA